MNEELYMHRALQLAALGLGQVSPNPMVGCVLVHENKIIGEGFHQKYGEAHAEVNAINSVENKELLPFSTLFVTLEPCNHFGKTPPCTELILKHQIKKVVICNLDPNPLVSGTGVERLRTAGVEVQTGLLSSIGSELNKRFFTFHQKKRPYLILKWAQTEDRLIARENFDSKWISNEYSRKMVHKWRSEEDAILVGYRTVLHDNPKLTTRDWIGKNPIRLVIDPKKELADTFSVFDQQAQSIVLASVQDIFTLPSSIQSILVEGGSSTITQFLANDLWDEARVFTAPVRFGRGIAAPALVPAMKSVERMDVFGDELVYYYFSPL